MIDKEHATNEACLIVNNDEYLYNTFGQCETVTELSELFRVHVAPRIRKGIGQDVYNLKDISFGEFLEGIETKIGE